MNAEEEISKIENELDGARRDLHETLSAVNAKVEREVESLRPEDLVRNHLGRASVIAGIAGFMAGNKGYARLGMAIVVAALGYTVMTKITKHRSADGRETVIGQ